MPIYEYICKDCGGRFALLIGVTMESDAEFCTKCGGRKIVRVVSRVARGRSEDERLDEVGDRLERMGEPDSYSEVRDTLKDVGAALDDDVSEEMEAMFEDE